MLSVGSLSCARLNRSVPTIVLTRGRTDFSTRAYITRRR